MWPTCRIDGGARKSLAPPAARDRSSISVNLAGNQGPRAGVCLHSELLLDPQQLVPGCQPGESGQRPGLDLARRAAHRQIPDEWVPGEASPAGDDGAVARLA